MVTAADPDLPKGRGQIMASAAILNGGLGWSPQRGPGVRGKAPLKLKALSIFIQKMAKS